MSEQDREVRDLRRSFLFGMSAALLLLFVLQAVPLLLAAAF
jgi:hypothetical protein